MKKRNGLFYVLACLLISCGYHDNNSNISYKDGDQFYSMKASFNESRDKAVEHYLNEKVGKKNNISFLNLESDGSYTLNDGTILHLKKYPGYLKIELDKNVNSKIAYNNIKEICVGVKDVISR